ncbi:NusG domain II-containing protein [Clostridium sp. MT-14]|uniref:NusG domain II-containing protein n=1 Tax=Clostridium aromativorans TaxID=2836848 RepID=A0ABS8N9G3_9CLOT|nr:MULTISPECIES: NusG domain II-containing protein [Clostridium]KAA8667922.1 NusG domain II-containing protein [Clostridium sp. HV4-5-A1G]MCC9296475.1 NusG domain II-containing protein [Clostridium aromativorans]CAB1262831.1 NusG domain II-containing protein [Clostridiaceae bacterium BL-3]
MKKGDKIVIVFISILIIISLIGVYVYKSRLDGLNKIAVIKENGKIVRTIDLNSVQNAYEFTIKYGKSGFNKIRVEKGKIRISDSNSPRKIGMKMGWISQPGENVICIPYKLIVEIEGKDPRLNNVDAIAGQPADLQR